jgi:hypothetical protein
MMKVFERLSRSTQGVKRTVAIGTVLATVGVAGIATAQRTPTRSFTEEDVAQITRELRGVDPSTYYIRLPKYYYGRVVGTATYGTLSINEVRRVATTLNVQLNETGNIITVFDAINNGNEQGGCGGGGGGGGAGSHTPSATAGSNLGSRINVLLQNIDANQFQYLR